MAKTPIFSSVAKGPLIKIRCPDCEGKFFGSSDAEYCPHCYAEVKKSSKSKVKASPEDLNSVVFCNGCDTKFYSTIEDTDEIVNNMFCPICSSSDLEELDEDDDEIELKVEDEEEKEKEDEDEDEDEDKDDDEDEEEATKNALEGTNVNDLEAALVTQPEETWYFFKSGKPMFRLMKSKVHSDSHPIFATDRFLEIFQQRAKEISVASAIKEFDGEVLQKEEVYNSMDLENLAFERLRSKFVPRFIDCLGLAIEGASKGVYQDLNTELKASFFDELVARGLTEKDAQEAVEAAFYAAGTDVFASMVNKALELFNKDSKTFEEIKSTIQSSGIVKGHSSANEEDMERKELRARLSGGNIPVQSSEPVSNFAGRGFDSKTVDEYRERISFKK